MAAAHVELAYWMTVLVSIFLVIRIVIYALTQFAKGFAEVKTTRHAPPPHNSNYMDTPELTHSLMLI